MIIHCGDINQSVQPMPNRFWSWKLLPCHDLLIVIVLPQGRAAVEQTLEMTFSSDHVEGQGGISDICCVLAHGAYRSSSPSWHILAWTFFLLRPGRQYSHGRKIRLMEENLCPKIPHTNDADMYARIFQRPYFNGVRLSSTVLQKTLGWPWASFSAAWSSERRPRRNCSWDRCVTGTASVRARHLGSGWDDFNWF